MPTASQKTAFGPGKYRGQLFDQDRLKRFVDGTNAAIAAGVPIPLLKKHAVLDADDKTTMAFATDHGQGAGWITKVFLGDDGNIGWEARDVPDADHEAIEKGTARFTSPEFRENYCCEKDGVYEGPIIRHFAFTPLPGNPHQGPIETASLALGENLITNSFQFAEEEREPLVAVENGSTEEQEPSQHSETMLAGHHKLAADIDKKEFAKLVKKHGGTHSASDNHFEIPHVSRHRFRRAAAESGFSHGSEYHFKHPNQFEEGWSQAFTEVLDESIWEEAKKQAGAGDDEVVKGIYSRMGGRFKDSQHSEMSYHSVLSKFGYQPHPTKAGHYKNATGHVVSLNGNDWHHHDSGEKGSSAQSLHKHLTREHGSQHAEVPIDVTPTDATDTKVLDKNPDMPPITTDRSKLTAVLAGLKQKEIVLPSDFDFASEGAIDVLLAAINSSIAAEQKAEAENVDVEPEGNVQESSMPFSEQFGEKLKNIKGVLKHHGYEEAGGGDDFVAHTHKTNTKGIGAGHTIYHYNSGHWEHHDGSKPGDESEHAIGKGKGAKALHAYLNRLHSSQHEEEGIQFSEEELAAMSPKARQAIEAGVKALAEETAKRKAAEQEAIAFAEKERELKNNQARDNTIRNILTSKIPPIIKQKLLLPIEAKSVQFSEGTEQPLYTSEQVAQLLADNLPPALMFAEDDVVTADTPKVGKQVGKDPEGKPLYSPPTEDTFFEKDENALPSGHITPERAEELLRTSPLKGQYGSNGPQAGYKDPFLEKVERERGVGTVLVK